jgi:biopolymer transport protein ExbD
MCYNSMMRSLTLTIVALLVSVTSAAQAEPRSLEILTNGHVRFDGGAERSVDQLGTAIVNMKSEARPPEIRIVLEKGVHAESVVRILREFQRYGYDHIGVVANFRDPNDTAR